MVKLNTKNPRVKLLSESEDEVEILREQVESQKQQLRYALQLTEEYRQELELTEHELMLVQRELCTLLMSSVKLELDEAKELAKTILKSNKSTSESLAELLSVIYGSQVKPEEFEQIDSSITINPLKTAEANRVAAQNNEHKAMYKDLGVRFIGFKAHLVRSKARYCNRVSASNFV